MFGCLPPPLDSFGCLAISGCPRSIYWNKLHRVSLKFKFFRWVLGISPKPQVCKKKKKSKFTFLWVLFPQGDRNLGGLCHFPLGLGISPGGLIHSHLVLSLPSIQLRAELSLVPDSSLPLRLKGTRSTTLVPAAQISHNHIHSELCCLWGLPRTRGWVSSAFSLPKPTCAFPPHFPPTHPRPS